MALMSSSESLSLVMSRRESIFFNTFFGEDPFPFHYKQYI